MGIVTTTQTVITDDHDGSVINPGDQVFRVRVVVETGDGTTYQQVLDKTVILNEKNALAAQAWLEPAAPVA